MGLLGRLFGIRDRGQGVEELARRLGVGERELRAARPVYRAFTIPKRGGGERQIVAPDPATKSLQRKILHKLLARLKVHPAVNGFERGRSIVTNALPHVAQPIVVRLDLKNFFASTTAKRVESYFHRIGWNKEAASLLCGLVTHDGGLPQGAPTSPRLSNLVNYRLDARLEALAHKLSAVYTRYADDITFSFAEGRAGTAIFCVKQIVRDEGYELHTHKKLRIARSHNRQIVTGLVVNEKVDLPRHVRRRLRAVEHHLAHNRPAKLSEAQLAGWRALQHMISVQAP